jgi:hypothetical protein
MAVEAVALALLSVLVVGLLRSHAEILKRLHDLGAGLDDHEGDGAGARTGSVAVAPPSPRMAGNAAPEIVGVTPGDEAVALAPSAAGRDTVLAFLTTGCISCHGFWDALAQSDAASTPTGARVVVVTRGPGEESVGTARKLAGDRIDVVMSSEAWAAYGVPGAPYFVQVDGRSGRVAGEGTAKTWAQVVQLLSRAALDDAAAAPSPAGPPNDDGPAGPWASDAEREARIDRELQAAGIGPGDPRLFHSPDGARLPGPSASPADAESAE